VIFKVNFKFKFEKFRVFVTFYKNLYTQLRRQAQKTSAPAPAKSYRSTGSDSATLVIDAFLKTHENYYETQEKLSVFMKEVPVPYSAKMLDTRARDGIFF
jgi:hypothetical protein